MGLNIKPLLNIHMKRLFIFISILIYAIGSVYSENLTTAQIVQLAKSKSISEISSIAANNGYKLAYKKEGAKGYESYNVTDIAWAFNATYIPSLNSWKFSENFSAIKLLYNNVTNQPETIVYAVSNGSYFHQIRNQITSYGYAFYKEDTTTNSDAIGYCYYNDNLKMYAIFLEYCGRSNYQIHFYHLFIK